MDNRLERIALNWIGAGRKLENLEVTKPAIEASGVASFQQIEHFERELVDEFEEANIAFWNAFKYPLEIFDVNKGEIPNNEIVKVFDEIGRDWINAFYNTSIADNEGYQLREAQSGNPLDKNCYHRWTRLPVLEKEL